MRFSDISDLTTTCNTISYKVNFTIVDDFSQIINLSIPEKNN